MANILTNPKTGSFRSATYEEGLVLFQEKYTRRGPDECWLWEASQTSRKYGQFRLRGLEFTSGLAHRWAYYFAYGEVPVEVNHRCNVPLCVNPNHLEDATRLSNEQHKTASGRRPRGVKDIPCSKCGGDREGRAQRKELGKDGKPLVYAYCIPCRKEYQRRYHEKRKAR